ncbi:MAG: hypothetical protein J6V32_04530 [Elusimicrobiaceae bacterium]|nr:hypothetical protein [Elusimicrobiaceae bacterium]
MDVLLNTPPLNVQENMALDEQIVQLRPQAVTLRFYNWVPGPAVTFGYAQFVQEVRHTLQGRHFVGSYTRRPTGGGMVFHTDDLTFSLVFSSQDKPTDIYQKLHTAILAQLRGEGLPARVFEVSSPRAAYAPSGPEGASACFVRPVQNDLLTPDGQKILGGAIRRFGNTVLYQGSLQLPGARTKPALKRAVIEGVRAFLAVDLHPSACGADRLARVRQLAAEKYAASAWTEKF